MSTTTEFGRTRAFLNAWEEVAGSGDPRPAAIFGTTPEIEQTLRIFEDSSGPRIEAIILAEPDLASTIRGVPVCAATRTDPARFSCVVVAADTGDALTPCEVDAWVLRCPPHARPQIIRFDDQATASEAAERGHRGLHVRRGFQSGVREVSCAGNGAKLRRDHPGPNRPAEAIDPVLEIIGQMQTPEFTVGRKTIGRMDTLPFKDHQLYPGSPHSTITDLREADFVTRPEPGLVTKQTRISVLGSCFALRLKEWLVENEYNFCQFEDGPSAMSCSLRCGEIYNTGSFAQMFRWAFDGFDAAEPYWYHQDTLIDPYRKNLCWADESNAKAERKAHFEAVRTLARQTDVLVATVGLSEVWRSKLDRSCFALVPFPHAYDPDMHEHALLSVEENTQNLDEFYARLIDANPSIRLVITLSPVPLVATFFDRHVVQSDAVSKACLRVALHEFCQRHPEVIYFPAYEIATRTPDWPYVADNMHIRREPTVNRIMRSFADHYG